MLRLASVLSWVLWLTSEDVIPALLSCENPVAIIVTRKSPMLSSSLIQPVIIFASSFAISRILLPITSNSSVVRSEPVSYTHLRAHET